MAAYVTDPAYGYSQAFNITASQNIKVGIGMIAKVIVNAAPTAAAGIYDSATVGGAGAANQILSIPTTAVVGTIYNLQWGVTNGITLVTTGGIFVVSYS
ncbi:MAG: hypothetical protein C5B60_01550 [Chloroflexi bacterium]|nr:MAG: hypothetical protein C5B60_01550 [Chloroflexota bacterium]